jgi:hypothetical protein
MSITPIFTIFDNSVSLVPIVAKDIVSSTGKVVLAYKESGKESKECGEHEARERFIEEFGTSVFWLGGIPFFKKVFDKMAPSVGIDPEIHIKALLKNPKLADPLLKNVAHTKNKYIAFNAVKFVVSTIIPFYLLSGPLITFNQKLTRSLSEKKQRLLAQSLRASNSTSLKNEPFIGKTVSLYSNDNLITKKQGGNKSDKNTKISNKAGNPSFKGGLSGISDYLIKTLQGAQNDPVSNMMLLDIGIFGRRYQKAGDRINDPKSIADEKFEIAIRESGFIFFTFVAQKLFQPLFDNIAGKFFKTPINLNMNVLTSKRFKQKINEISSSANPAQELKKFLKVEGAGDEIIDNIDKEIAELIKNKDKAGYSLSEALYNEGSLIPKCKGTRKSWEIWKLQDNFLSLKNPARDPRKYLDPLSIFNSDLKNNKNTFVSRLNNFIKTALKPENIKDINQFIDKAVKIKKGSIFANFAICAAFLGYFLPKLQYYFREKRTGSTMFPGVRTLMQAERLQAQATELSNNNFNTNPIYNKNFFKAIQK